MNSRERVVAALQHRNPDRTPIFEYVLLSPLADRLLGRTYAADPANWEAVLQTLGWEGAVRQCALDLLEIALLLGHDMIYAVPNPDPPTTRPEPTFPPEHLSADPVERVRIRNERAASARIPSENSLLVYVYLKEEMQRRSVDLPVLAPAYVHGVWTDVDLMQTMLLSPEVAHEHFTLATQWALERIEQYLGLGIDQVGVGGDFSGTHPLISPSLYHQFIVPQVRQLSRRIHQLGGYAVNASDGNLWPVLDDFLFGCEVDGYLEIDMFAGMDLRRLKSICRKRVTLYGNLDCGNILSFSTPEQVVTHVIDCLEAGTGDGGHILCASNAITASIPLENYVALVNAYRGVFGLKKFTLRE